MLTLSLVKKIYVYFEKSLDFSIFFYKVLPYCGMHILIRYENTEYVILLSQCLNIRP
jgi:hypothetical protein